MDSRPTRAGLTARLTPYTASDITLVISVRAQSSNPWLLPRLRMLAGHYEPMPAIVISDVGSPGTFRGELEQCCADSGFEYVRVDDENVFSAAVGRNRGAEAAASELLFFSDVDCFGERDLFARLAKHANDMRLGECFDQVVVLPAYHLTHEVTDIVTAADPSERGDLLAQAMVAAVFGARNDVVDYVDPFSNFLLCRRDFFSFVGGYNETFRGHGSEDFEFLLRCAAEGRQLPLPRAPARDRFSPARNAFFSGRKPYVGFRRLGELMAYPAEAAGLRIAHLHHERSTTKDSWYAEHDVRRARLKRETIPYLRDDGAALRYDWLEREKSALVVLARGRAARDLVMPMRMCGYRLTPWVVEELAAVDAIERALDEHDELILVEPGLPSDALQTAKLQELATRHAAWVIAAGTAPGEFIFRRYVAGQLCFEESSSFRPCISPVVDGKGEPGWIFERLPFGVSTAGRAGALRLFAPNSYASGKLQLAICRDDIEERSARNPPSPSVRPADLLARRYRKLLHNPKRFLADSRFALLRAVGAILLGRQVREHVREPQLPGPIAVTTTRSLVSTTDSAVKTR